MNLSALLVVLLGNALSARAEQRESPFVPKNATLREFVTLHGYPFEDHHRVFTEDGYVLTVHRIPVKGTATRGAKSNGPPPVLMMHGLLGSSADWILPGPNRSLALLLADNGYDVWLGNSRGNTNSKLHTRLSTDTFEYWDFSWHEMGLFDAPAMIDYVLEQTGHERIFWIGYSQGTTLFWVLASLRPEYNEKIKLMVALAPVAYAGHLKGLLKFLSFFANLPKDVYRFTGFFEIFPNAPWIRYITANLCRRYTFTQPLCEMFLYSIGGFSPNEMDHANLARYLQVIPAGCSFKQLVHYSMTVQNPGHFRPYDYGRYRNLRIYGSVEPPEYPLDKITAPVALYDSTNDFLASAEDVKLLAEKLPNVVEHWTVTKARVNHLDFTTGRTIHRRVYRKVIQRMSGYV